MKKIIALAFADFHLAIWKQHNEGLRRTKLQLEFFTELKRRASHLRVPILFAGDFMHDPKYVDNELLSLLSDNLNIHFGSRVFSIPGNHDQAEVNYRDKTSPNYIQWFQKQTSAFQDVSYRWSEFEKFWVGGIPYIKNNRDYVEIVKDMYKKRSKDLPNILLIHTNLPGAKEPNGLEIDDTQNIGRELHKYFKGFDLVLSGHIHRHQKLASNVYMIGAPSQQRVSDSGCKMGYIEIYEDLSIKFRDSLQPEFIYLPYGQDKPDDYHFYIEMQKEVPKKETEEGISFSKNFKPEILGKKYLKVKGIKDKSKKDFLFNLLKTI